MLAFTLPFLLPVILFYIPVLANIMPEFVPKDDSLILSLVEGPGTPVGTPLHKFKGTDWDGDTLTFTLDEESMQYFKIARASHTEANLVLHKELDREDVSEFVMEVTLEDGRTKKPATQTLLVIVEDINDNAPVFDQINQTFAVEEGSNVPQLVGTFTATDPDEGPNGDVNFSLKFLDPDDESLFSVLLNEDDEAELYAISPLDYETKTSHVIQLVAFDEPEEENVTSRETVVNITINVIDISDKPPVFLPMAKPDVEIPEDIPLYSVVTQVQAIDGDKGFNSSVTYELLSDQDKFTIDDFGIIKTNFRFNQDHDSVGIYRIRVQATETGFRMGAPTEAIPHKEGSAMSTETEVVVNVTEVWGSPHFRNETYVGHIPENSPPGYPVPMEKSYLAEVFDNDKNGRDLIKLTIEGDGDTFEVLPKAGFAHISFQIVVLNNLRLDYENLQELDFHLVAEDSVGNRTKILVSVFITDQNDNYPEFSMQKYFSQIPENPPNGLIVASLAASDKDSGIFGGEGLRYIGLRGTAKGQLQLDEISGEITVITDTKSDVFDREKNPEIYMAVEVKDDLGRGNGDTATVVIQLQDENDNSPQFFQSFYETEISENVNNISLALRISASDADESGTNNSQIRFSITADRNMLGGQIDIDPTTGVLFLNEAFDFEDIFKNTPNFPFEEAVTGLRIPVNFTLKATDLGNPQQMSTVPLTVYVIDKNDCAPKFKSLKYQTSIREDVNSSSEIVVVEATDEDASEVYNKVVYSLNSNDVNKFKVDPKTGVISLAEGYTLDWNLKTEHTFNVSCTDQMSLKCVGDAIVKITLLDVNNKPPKFVGQMLPDICEIDKIFTVENQTFLFHYVASIPENSSANLKIAHASATDPDSSAELRYKILYENKPIYFKHGRIIPCEDGEELDKYLHIDSKSGLITTGNAAFDFEKVEKLSVEISVEDIAGETNLPQVAIARLLIEIENVLDVKPRFLLTEYRVTIKENVPVGTVVANVKAVEDEEIGEMGNIQYSLSSSVKEILPFEIDATQGVIWVNGSIDREKVKSFNILVKATKTKALWATVPVFVEVEDENDNWPIFTDSVSEISVEENMPLDTALTQVQAKDADSGPNGKVIYKFEEKSPANPFKIDATSGIISVSGKIDHEKKESYDLVVKAIDSMGQPQKNKGISHESRKTLHVHVKDANDNKPEFSFLPSLNRRKTNDEHSLEYFVYENFTENVLIFMFTVTDRDQKDTPNSQVSVKIASIERDNEETAVAPFKLTLEESEQGSKIWSVVTTRSLVGFEGAYEVTLEARDMGRPPNKNLESVHIHVLEANTNASTNAFRFARHRYVSTVLEDYQENTEIIQLAITSSIHGQPNKPKFELGPSKMSEAHCMNLFKIHSVSGIVTARYAKGFKKCTRSVYNLNATLSWTSGHKKSRHVTSTRLMVFMVSGTQTTFLVSRMEYKETTARLWSYRLGRRLESILGLLVSVRATKISSTNTILFRVSVICPRTNQVLEESEIQKVFISAEPEINKIFTEFQIIPRRRSYAREANGMFARILEKFWLLLFAPNENAENGFSETTFHFRDSNMVYLYFITLLGYILLIELVLILCVLACKFMHKAINKRTCYCNFEEIDYKHLVLNGYTNIPEELQRLFVVQLSSNDSFASADTIQSDC